MSIDGQDIGIALRRYRRLLGGLALLSAVINLLVLVPSLYMMQVYDRVLLSRNETTLLMLTLIAVALYAFSAFLEWIRGQVLVRISAGFDLQLGTRVFDAAFARNLRERDVNPSQQLNDLTQLRQFIAGPGLIALFDAPWLPVFVLVAFLFHPWFGVMTLLGALLLLALAAWNDRAVRAPLDEAGRIAWQANTYVNGSLRNAEVIQAMGMLSAMRQRWSALQQGLMEAQSRASDRGAAITAMSRCLRITGQSLALGLGALLVLEGQISPGMMIAMSVLLGRALAPVELIIGSWRHYGAARQAHGRLAALLVEQPEVAPGLPLPAPTGALRVEQLQVFAPGAEQPALNGVGFSLKAGEALAVIGGSGSGKSSLARALVGVWPIREGSIRLDGARLEQWPAEALGPHIGYLPQDIELFDGSVAENIARFGDLDSPRIIEAARLAGVHELILRLPLGYDTRLGPAGLGLSGGQRQRIALARTLYGQPRLLVMDEPNSNLDEAGEQALVRALTMMKARGCTVVVITHRMAVLEAVDQILLLRDGVVQLHGPRAQVLRALQGPRETCE